MTNSIAFKPIYLKVNQGHGNARRISVDNSSNELIALMDADDISLKDRFQKQLKLFIDNHKLDICGGNITEFIEDEANIVARREVKQQDKDIKKDLKKRCPMNQVTVMFKKQAYELAGGYLDWYCEEDYYLWTRMIQKGCSFGNVLDDIVNVRTGLDMSSRRGGWKYYKSEKKFQEYLLKNKLISFPRYLYNIALRFGGEVLLPNSIRNKAFKIMRSNISDKKDNINYNNEDTENIKITYPKFSVAMCVYGKDNPDWFDRSLESVLVEQTVKPDELVLVVDGPIPDTIKAVIDKYAAICAGGGYNI